MPERTPIGGCERPQPGSADWFHSYVENLTFDVGAMNPGATAPMIVNDNSSVFAFFAEICYNHDPFLTLVRETRGGETKLLRRGEGLLLP